MIARAWPATLTHGDVTLRPLRQLDGRAWREVRTRNADWLRPWEASLPPEAEGLEEVPSFSMMVRRLRREARQGRTLPFAVTYQGRLVGQLTVGGITWGSLRAAYVGYWIDREVAGRGIMPTSVALALDHCVDVMNLHRVEVNIRPENAASLRVVEKLGLQLEGGRREYLHIDGAWRDHLVFVLHRGDFPDGVLTTYLRTRTPS